MNNVKTLLLAACVTTALPLSAAQYVFVAGNDSMETKLCIAAAENNLKKYKKTARAFSLNKSVHQVVANKLSCNDQNLASFAWKYGAADTAGFIGRYTESGVIIRREISDASKSTNSALDDQTIYVTVN